MTPKINTSSDSKKDRYLLTQIIRFSRQLHNAGVNVNLTNLIDLFSCIKHIDISNPDDFYTANCATLISSNHDMDLFDQIYNAFWYGEQFSVKTKKNPTIKDSNELDDLEKDRQREIKKQKPVSNSERSEDTQTSSQTTYSPNEYFMKKDLGLMSPEELEQTRCLIAELITIIANIQKRRHKKSHRGHELFFREMLKRNASHGSDGMEILFRKKRIKKTRLMLLCDVSGSMEQYSRFLINIIYAMHQELNRLDVAVFSTHMSVITDCLNAENIDDSLDEVTKTAHDWAGGTDIGQCLHELNYYLSKEIASSRTIVIILSDGWDRGNAAIMAEQMKNLHHQAHKILWLNPLLADNEYRPLCQGMQTALPYIDYFMPAHNLESFTKLIEQLRLLWR